jgi:hypothetical protein
VTAELADARRLAVGQNQTMASSESLYHIKSMTSVGVDGGAKWRGAWWERWCRGEPRERWSCCRLSSACGGGCGRNERNEVIITKAGGEVDGGEEEATLSLRTTTKKVVVYVTAASVRFGVVVRTGKEGRRGI